MQEVRECSAPGFSPAPSRPGHTRPLSSDAWTRSQTMRHSSTESVSFNAIAIHPFGVLCPARYCRPAHGPPFHCPPWRCIPHQLNGRTSTASRVKRSSCVIHDGSVSRTDRPVSDSIVQLNIRPQPSVGFGVRVTATCQSRAMGGSTSPVRSVSSPSAAVPTTASPPRLPTLTALPPHTGQSQGQQYSRTYSNHTDGQRPWPGLYCPVTSRVFRQHPRTLANSSHRSRTWWQVMRSAAFFWGEAVAPAGGIAG